MIFIKILPFILPFYLAIFLIGLVKEDVLPALSEEEMTEVLNEAAQFVHSKQLPGENLDDFADYLDVSSQMINKRLKEKV